MTTPIERLAIRYSDGSMNVLSTTDLDRAKRERDFDRDPADTPAIVRVSLTILETVDPGTQSTEAA